jgi:hypothetical protein
VVKELIVVEQCKVEQSYSLHDSQEAEREGRDKVLTHL